jgi:hypothetical protein
MEDHSSSRSSKLQAAVDGLVSVVMELRELERGDDTGLPLGELILRERGNWNYSLADLARKIGASKAHVWELESGRSINPTSEMVGKLASALVVPPIHVLNAALLSQRLRGTNKETDQ